MLEQPRVTTMTFTISMELTTSVSTVFLAMNGWSTHVQGDLCWQICHEFCATIDEKENKIEERQSSQLHSTSLLKSDNTDWQNKDIPSAKKKQKNTIIPSKPRNFGPHGNVEPFFRGACYHRSASYRKVKRIKAVEKLQIYKFGSVHFWYIIHPKKLRNLQKKKKKSKVSMRCKVG